jgi:hypothetical protein
VQGILLKGTLLMKKDNGSKGAPIAQAVYEPIDMSNPTELARCKDKKGMAIVRWKLPTG